jgi:hypothetical protein
MRTNNMRIILNLLPLLSLVATATAAEPPKNIILIMADDLGWADTTLYGKTSLYETPNIERLAARGMTFSSASASPICSPTRASIMTGQNPARLGMTAPAAHLEAERFEATASERGPPHQKSTNVKSATRLDCSLPTLGKVLKGAGYATAHFGKWHLGREPHAPLELGFDVDIPHWYVPRYTAGEVVNGRLHGVVKQLGIARGLTELEVDVSAGLFPAQGTKLVADGNAIDEVGMLSAPHSWEQLQGRLANWLSDLPKPLGLMAANDAWARHVLEACRRRGLRVPEDISCLSRMASRAFFSSASNPKRKRGSGLR